jgi:hypothetical protein
MPRLKKGDPPSYRHHKPSGQAIVTIDGHDYYLGKHGTPASRQKYWNCFASVGSGKPLRSG